jgi:hypothetical protein
MISGRPLRTAKSLPALPPAGDSRTGQNAENGRDMINNQLRESLNHGKPAHLRYLMRTCNENARQVQRIPLPSG